MSEVERLLADRREAVLADWRERIFADYPPGAADQWRREKDRFRNPVGSTIAAGTEAILDALIDGAGPDGLRAAADGIVRLRAVQELPPSRAVSFAFALKGAVRKALGREAAGREAEVERLLDAIDALALTAFDLYSECREKISEIRVREAQARVYKLAERAGRHSTKRGELR
jgi:hypothetical protein